MDTSQTIIEVPATPDYVLEVLLDQSRQYWSKNSLISEEEEIPVILRWKLFLRPASSMTWGLYVFLQKTGWG